MSFEIELGENPGPNVVRVTSTFSNVTVPVTDTGT
jgi:hypothetical protein